MGWTDHLSHKLRQRGHSSGRFEDNQLTWMKQDVLETVSAELRKHSSAQRVRFLRDQNRTLQLEQQSWTMVIELMLMKPSYKESPEGKAEVKRIEEELVREAKAGWNVPGPVGDLPLHTPFLLGQYDQGKRLIEEYYNTPEKISYGYSSDLKAWMDSGFLGENDPWDDGGLYTGETVLHIAIVHQNCEAVEWLLDRGASLTARATGAFFKAEKIKSKSSLQRKPAEEALRALINLLRYGEKGDGATHLIQNKESACNYGELPLSFAASIGSIEVCKILTDRASSIPVESFPDEIKPRLKPTQIGGRQPVSGCRDWLINAQDSLGNTALHMAVFHQNLEVVDWLMANGGKKSLQILNDAGLTPFTLAVRQGYLDIYKHFLHKHLREIIWMYGTVQMTKLSLEQVDTFKVVDNRLHASKAWKSAVEIIVEHEVESFANDELFNQIIRHKWDKFGRRMYLRRTLLPYFLLLCTFCAVVYLRCDHIPILASEANKSKPFHEFKSVFETDRWAAAVIIMEFICACIGAPWLIYQGWRQRRLRPQDFDEDMDGKIDWLRFFFKNMAFFLNFGAASVLICTLTFRCLAWENAELDCLAIGCVIMWINFLFLFLPFKFFGVMVITTYKMLVGDIAQFLVVYFITTSAFATAIFVLFQQSGSPEQIEGLDRIDLAFLQLVWVSLGNMDIMEQINESRNFYLLLAIHLAYVVLEAILLLNLVIAMMGQTFLNSTADTHKTWIFPFAYLVLRYESMLPQSVRSDPRYRSGKSEEPDALTSSTRGNLDKSIFYEIHVGEDPLVVHQRTELQSQLKQHRPAINRIANMLSTSQGNMAGLLSSCEGQTEESFREFEGSISSEVKDMKSQIQSLLAAQTTTPKPETQNSES